MLKAINEKQILQTETRTTTELQASDLGQTHPELGEF